MKIRMILKILVGIICLLSGLAVLKAQTVTDIDGNIYSTVTIGTQTWMADNLKTTSYNDGTPIPLVAGESALVGSQEVPYWNLLNTGAYCWYNNEAEYKNVYGALYNWYAATSNLCPTGWHVPTADDWRTLISYLGDSNAGGKLKEKGTTHWHSPNTGATNETGFTALPGGGRYGNGSFHDLGYQGIIWSSTTTKVPNGTGKGGTIYQNARYISCDLNNLDHLSVTEKKSGFSVRCVCDNITSGINNINSEEVIFYPNPVNDRLYFKNNNYANALIMIYDLQGKKVLDRKVDSEFIDVSNFKKGIYIVKFVWPEKMVITKLIKE